MYTYDLLENGCYYLVKKKRIQQLRWSKLAVETDHCLFIQRFDDPTETEWKLKKDALFDIIECLQRWSSEIMEEHYSNEDEYSEEEEEDDDKKE